MRFWFC